MTEQKKPENILDNYSFKELDAAFMGVKGFKFIFEIAKNFGYRNLKLDESFKNIEKDSLNYKKLKDTLSKFNQYFVEKGWIAFESLNKELMETCVKFAEQGNLKRAEEELINYYSDSEKIGILIKRLIYFKEFQPRKDLFLKALDDHFNERYHSSVPLFLMMIDGFVNDIEQYGFFTDKVDINIWDTIVGHESNMGKIHEILNKGRKKTIEEYIDLPYRNGILHGRDLGYANSKVSAKSLGILFSLRDWADAIGEGKRQNEKEFALPSLRESFEEMKQGMEQFEENRIEREYMSNVWKPREINVGFNFPSNGSVEDYEIDSPERKMVEFLFFLLRNNYGKLATCITNLTKQEETISKWAGELRQVFEGKHLIKYELIEVKDIAAAVSEIKVFLEFKSEKDLLFKDIRVFRLLYQDTQSNPVIRGYSDGEWKILFNFYDIEYLGYK